MDLKDRKGLTTTGDTLPAETPFEGGDLIVHYLQQIGVEYIFGVPGGAIEPLVNAIARGMRRGGPKLVVARHESGAAFMADGYARETGKLGVCFATTGPGATNMITGVAGAYHNRNPVLAITAQTRLETFGRGAMQESSDTAVNTVGMFQYCTHYNSLISHSKQLAPKLTAAILRAFREPRGAVHLSVPLDIMRIPQERVTPPQLQELLAEREALDLSGTAAFAKEIEQARKVVFLIGEGSKSATPLVLTLAQLLRAQVLVTPHAKGMVSPFHPCFRGVFGFAGHQSAEQALHDPDVDCVIAVGCSLGEWATGGWDERALLNERLIHVDSDPAHFAASPKAHRHLCGSLPAIFKIVLAELTETLERRPNATPYTLPVRPTLKLVNHASNDAAPNCSLDEPDKWRSDATPIKPQRLMHELPRLLPAGTRFIADGVAAKIWATHYLHIPDRRGGERRSNPNQWNALRQANTTLRRLHERRSEFAGLFRTSMEFSCMGWGIGHAVGAAFGNPSVPVVCLTGDGSMLMNGQEITVALQHRLSVFFVVLNDAALGTIRHGQLLGGAEQIGWELPEINFAELSKAMGVPGFRVRTPEDLLNIDWNDLWKQKMPAIIDVCIDRNEVSPIGQRMKSLGIGH